MTTTLSAFLAIGLASHFCRMSLMVNNPERYEQFHRFELQLAKVENTAAKRIVAEGKRAIGWLIRKMTKRK